MRDSWQLLGVDVSATGGGTKPTGKKRIGKLDVALKRLAHLPVYARLKVLPTLSFAISKMVYGRESEHLGAWNFRIMRTSVLAVVWQGCARRCPEIAANWCMKGHLLDPEAAVIFFSVMSLWRLVRDERALKLWRDAWGIVARAAQVRILGPVTALMRRMLELQWTSEDGLNFIMDDGNEFNLTSVAKTRLQHQVRDGIRRMMMRRAALRRRDYRGAECNVDVKATMANITDVKEPCRKSLLNVVAGAVITQRVRWLGSLTDSELCPFCEVEAEDVEHLLWRCSAWVSCRSKLEEKFPLYRSWPPAMKLCGIYIQGVEGAPTPKQWRVAQRTMGEIVAMRYALMREKGILGKKAWPPKPGKEGDPVTDELEEEDDDFDGLDRHTGDVIRSCDLQRPYPLYRRFAEEGTSNCDQTLELKDFKPSWGMRSSAYYGYGKPSWKALTWYWQAVKVDSESKAKTPWAAIAVDLILACGYRTLARADGDTSMGSIISVVKSATWRIGALCKCQLLAEGGTETSGRLRTLWLPARTAANIQVRLLRPEAVDAVLMQWAEHALDLELGAEDSASVREEQRRWQPRLAESCKYRRASQKQKPRFLEFLDQQQLDPQPSDVPAQDDSLVVVEGEDLQWQNKLKAKLRLKRLHSVKEVNAEAIREGSHIISAVNLDCRPKCALCGAERSAGRWRILSEQTCGFEGADGFDLKEEQRRCLAKVNIEFDEAIAAAEDVGEQPKVKRPTYSKNAIARNKRTEKAKPVMSFKEIAKMKSRKLITKEVKKHGLSAAEARKRLAAARGGTLNDNIAAGRNKGFKEKMERNNARGGKYHNFIFRNDEERIGCTKCGRSKVRALYSKWVDEECDA
jgi:hypothetical protein